MRASSFRRASVAAASTSMRKLGRNRRTAQSPAGYSAAPARRLAVVINNSGSAVFDLFITGFNASSPGILNFSSPAQAANAAELLCATTLRPQLSCAAGGTGDEGITSAGQLVFFTSIGAANGSPGNTGDVIFTGNLLPGQSAIFGTLQDILAAQVSPVPVPEPGSFAVLGTGLLGLALYRFRLRQRRRAAARLKPQQA